MCGISKGMHLHSLQIFMTHLFDSGEIRSCLKALTFKPEKPCNKPECLLSLPFGYFMDVEISGFQKVWKTFIVFKYLPVFSVCVPPLKSKGNNAEVMTWIFCWLQTSYCIKHWSVPCVHMPLVQLSLLGMRWNRE